MAGIASDGHRVGILHGVKLWLAAACVLLGLMIGLRGGGGSSGGGHGTEDNVPWEVRANDVICHGCRYVSNLHHIDRGTQRRALLVQVRVAQRVYSSSARMVYTYRNGTCRLWW